MSKNYEEILSTITAEQWEAIAAFAAEKARGTGVSENTETEHDIQKRATNLMNKIGCSASLLGYRYLRRAIVLVYNDCAYINAVTKLLYPEIAAEFNTTASRVERAIRHTIEVCFDRGDIEFLSQIFSWSPTKGKPTNTEAIAFMVEYLHNN